MVGYVRENSKGRRALLALLVALAVATVGIYLVISATAAKPAKAATYCNSYAYAPVHTTINGIEQMRFKGQIKCDAPIDGAKMRVYGQWRYNSSSAWAYWNVADTGIRRFYTSQMTYTLTPRYNCPAGDTTSYYEYRTVLTSAVVYNNGGSTTLPTRKSSAVPVTGCGPSSAPA